MVDIDQKEHKMDEEKTIKTGESKRSSDSDGFSNYYIKVLRQNSARKSHIRSRPMDSHELLTFLPH